MISKGLKVIISGGGTGGHIFPALAIAQELERQKVLDDLLFVGASSRMEMQIIPKAGYKILGLPILGFNRRKMLKNFWVLCCLFVSLIKAFFIVKKYSPDVVVGVGGYASGAVLKVASWLAIPTLIQEQNSYPGITNRLLANSVNKICVAYPKMDSFFNQEKIVFTGNPIRKEITAPSLSQNQAKSTFDLDQSKKTVLVLGGSLGAKTINQAVENWVLNYNTDSFQIIWQTGKYYKVPSRIIGSELVKHFVFIENIITAYVAADVVISRSGALTVSELSILSKPVVFIPSPNVAEDHQTKNAVALESIGAAILVKDNEAITKLPEVVHELLGDKEKMNTMSKQINTIAKPLASNNVVKEIISLCQ